MNLDLTCLQSIRTLADDIRRLADALILRSSAMPEKRTAELMAVLDLATHALPEVRDDLAALAQDPKVIDGAKGRTTTINNNAGGAAQ